MRLFSAASLNRNLLQARRTLLSASVLNGASVAIGLALIVALVYAAFGMTAASNAAVGAITVLITDIPRARRGKFAHLIAAPLLALPLFLAVQLLRGHPVELGLLLVPATFLAFLSTAWGRAGMPVSAAVMLAMLLAMAPQPATSLHEALVRTGWCACGAFLYLLYGTASNLLLNARYRTQTMAALLLSVADLLRVHARRVHPSGFGPSHKTVARDLGDVLRGQAALAEQLQAARDMILESPNTLARQRLAGLLIVVLELRDMLVAGELDIAHLQACQAQSVAPLAATLCAMAEDMQALADALLLGRHPGLARDHHAVLHALREHAQAHAAADPHDVEALGRAAVMRRVSERLIEEDAAVRQLTALARGDAAPNLSAVRSAWQVFVSPAYWSVQPLLEVWHWRQPALRHALRAGLAIGVGYALAMALPWGSRDYWILLTIVVVLRGSLAQTLERRNARVIGTLVGSSLAVGLLALHPPIFLLLAVVVIAQGVAHAFTVRHYVTTSVAGSVLGLVLAHMLFSAGHPAFDFLERVGDTLLGAGLAWAFAYVLPSWERHQIAGTVRRVGRAMARHAQNSLALTSLTEVTGQPELAWRLARREAYDALSALVQASGRALVEPRAVRPPITALEQLQGHSYQLLGQLSTVQSILLLHQDHLRHSAVHTALAHTATEIGNTLDFTRPWQAPQPTSAETHNEPTAVTPTHDDLTPTNPTDPGASVWLLRCLQQASHLACEVRADAERVLAAVKEATAAVP